MTTPDTRVVTVVEHVLGDTLRLLVDLVDERGLPVDPGTIAAASFGMRPVGGGTLVSASLGAGVTLPDPAVAVLQILVAQVAQKSVAVGEYDAQVLVEDQDGRHTVKMFRLRLTPPVL